MIKFNEFQKIPASVALKRPKIAKPLSSVYVIRTTKALYKIIIKIHTFYAKISQSI